MKQHLFDTGVPAYALIGRATCRSISGHEIHVNGALDVPPEWREELAAWQQGSAEALALVERLADEGEAGTDAREVRAFTVKEVAAILRVCAATVYAMVERGELPHVRVRHAIRVVVARPGKQPAVKPVMDEYP